MGCILLLLLIIIIINIDLCVFFALLLDHRYFGKKKPTEEDRAKAEKIKNIFLRTQEKKAHRDEKRDSF